MAEMNAELTSLAKRLLTSSAVRSRAGLLHAEAEAGRLLHFDLRPDRLAACADYVVAVIRSQYPQLAIPFHARWRHFVLGGTDRWQAIANRAGPVGSARRARAAFDLAIVSVLLDAGAGAQWTYPDMASGQRIGRSEGLALASLEMFAAGAFASDPQAPLRADAAALAALGADAIAQGFAVTPRNPLAGLEGRAALLASLGRIVAAAPDIFGKNDTPRPGGLFDHLAGLAQSLPGRSLPAAAILEALLTHLGPIWPSRLTLGGIGLGDTWRHPLAVTGDATSGLVPFHKLSQWLSYSLIEPLVEAGITVVDIDGLTGLPEYRNGGLLLDAGVIALKDVGDATRAHEVGSPLVVEWRALTVALLDRMAPLVRERLGLAAADFPLAKLLEGGSWAAGRRIAREKRADGGPPLSIISDGTVF
jgi:hypothetical protein